mmetsp:Transcript_55656/g.133181  ORF Transcript_55656/g.133181 Transcript_55656/m.133181 type:complete len:362 (+) Transcript_55656:64-1149(+)
MRFLLGLLLLQLNAAVQEPLSCESTSNGPEEDDSDDVTLLAMPMKTTKRMAPRSVREAPSFFQVDEEKGQVAAPAAQAFLTPFRSLCILGVACLFLSVRFIQKQGSELRERVLALPLRSAEDIRQHFGAPSDRPEWQLGMLMRIEGRVLARSGQAMATPFSERQCVLYSASASQRRQDGVHQPPLAYHSACTDFVIQLDNPGGDPLQVAVDGQEVALFDIQEGRFGQEAAFSDVPEGWRGFALAHLHSNACNPSCTDLQGALDFCESALLEHARVTCVGELVRDRNGEFRLCPWRPPVAGMDMPKTQDTLRSTFRKFWSQETTALAGQVFISDCTYLVNRSSLLWSRVAGQQWHAANLLSA